MVHYLGTYNSPWEVEVSLQSGGNGAAMLLGTTTVTFTNGTASFTDLTINHPDDDYVLHFTVVQPVEASSYVLDTLPFQVCSLLSAVSLPFPLPLCLSPPPPTPISPPTLYMMVACA